MDEIVFAGRYMFLKIKAFERASLPLLTGFFVSTGSASSTFADRGGCMSQTSWHCHGGRKLGPLPGSAEPKLLSDPINRQTYQSAKPPLFDRATWSEDAAVERGELGKEKG